MQLEWILLIRSQPTYISVTIMQLDIVKVVQKLVILPITAAKIWFARKLNHHRLRVLRAAGVE